MTRSNQAAFDYLDHYLDRSPAGEGAVLVRGAWGSGKTHSLKAYLAARDARRLRAEPLADRHIYASLYGVATHDQLIERVFAARHPLLNHAVLRALFEGAGRAANFITRNAAIKHGDGAGLREFILSLRDAVIVLDDLERSVLPPTEIMGFLNDFVEHQGVKAILVAAEEQIDDKNFELQKEKLIVRTVELRSETASVYDHLTKRINCAVAKKIAQSSKEAVLREFAAAGLHNLRSLRIALDDFDRIISTFEDILAKSETAVEQILRQTVVMWAYIRAGTVKADDFKNSSNLAFSAFYTNKSDETDFPLKTVVEKHRDIEWYDPVISTAALASLAATGQLDVSALRETIAKHPLVIGSEMTPAWRRLWQWQGLSTKDFAKVTTQLLDDLASFNIREPGKILHVAGTAIHLSLFGYSLGGQPPLDLLTRYIDDLAKRDILEPDFHLREAIAFSSYEELGFAASETDEFLQISQHLLLRVDEAIDRRTASIADTVLKRLSIGNFTALTDYAPANGGFRGVPILHHINPRDFASILLVDGAVTLNLPTILADRYRHHSDDAHPLKSEFDWVHTLKAELDKRTAILAPPHRDWAEGIFASMFDKILAQISRPTTE